MKTARKKHKYIVRIPYKNNKYRYFYTQSEYEAYLTGLTSASKKKYSSDYKISESERESLENTKELEKQSGKDVYRSGDEYEVQIAKDSAVKNLLTVFKKVASKFSKSGKTPKLPDDILDIPSASLKKDASKDGKVKKVKSNKDKVTTKPLKGHKYIAKIKISDGSYRYFYDQDEYNAYLKKKEYQKNSPSFMDGFEKTPATETSEEALAKINPHVDWSYSQYKYYNELSEEQSKQLLDSGKVTKKTAGDAYAYDMNCMNCTTAYELRRRGYDVEAGAWRQSNTQYASLENWYKGVKIKEVKDTDNLVKAIKSDNPPGSRGNLMVQWAGGGGHSMVYEVDSKGSVHILDPQTNSVVDEDKLPELIQSAKYARTDNLELKKGVLDTVAPNHHN